MQKVAGARALGCFVVGYSVTHHNGLFGSTGLWSGTRLADWIDLSTPFIVLLPLLSFLWIQRPTRRLLLVAAIGSILYVEGHGIHLSANSIGNVVASNGAPKRSIDTVHLSGRSGGPLRLVRRPRSRDRLVRWKCSGALAWNSDHCARRWWSCQRDHLGHQRPGGRDCGSQRGSGLCRDRAGSSPRSRSCSRAGSRRLRRGHRACRLRHLARRLPATVVALNQAPAKPVRRGPNPSVRFMGTYRIGAEE